jgi:hypothetical protein
MFLDPYTSFIGSLLKAWQTRERQTRLAIVTALISMALALITLLLAKPGIIEKNLAETVGAVLGATAAILAMGVIAYQNLLEEQAKQSEIASVQERVLEHPEKPQFAWDLARTKLENYLDRNLAQVRSIYWLTLFVMLCGFGFIMYGLYYAFQSPDKLPVSIVASASGVLISFIGGSLLLIYRSVLAQSKDYVVVLERINAVGMAVQVIASIPESGAELKNQTTAELARQLLTLYAAKPMADAKVGCGET